tara:strand:- start:737 stop:3781 length:3045 start_codon:yes stop_codon:yes gene_type:complete
MINAKGAELHGTLREDLIDLPYDPTSMESDIDGQNEEYQVAGAILNKLGLGTARVLSGDIKGEQSKIYKRIKEMQAAQENAAQLRTGEPQDLSGVDAEPLMDFVDPNEAFPAPAGLLPPPEKAVEPAPQPGAVIAEEASDQVDVIDRPSSLVEEQQDEYKYYQSLGDDALNRIMESRMQKPDIQNGILGGIRVTGTQPGMEVKIPDEGSVRNLIGSIAEEIQPNMHPDVSRQISLDETQELADLIGSNPKRLHEMLKRGFNIDPNNPGALAAHVSAAKNLFFEEAKRLDGLADVAAAPNASLQQKLEWKQQADLVANLQSMYKGAQTDIARALNAMKLPARNVMGLSREDAQALVAKDYKKLADDIGGVDSLDEAIEAYRAAPDLMDRLEVINGGHWSRKVFNAWHEVWINSILSGPWTHLKNMAGGFAAIWNDNANTAAVAAMQGVTRGVFGMKGGVRDVTFGDLQAKMFGQFMATQEALAAAGKGFRTREELFGSSKLESRITGRGGSRATATRYDAFSAEAFGAREGSVGGHAINALGSMMTMGRGPTRLLVAEDAFIKVVAYRGALYELAYRDARLSGKQGDAFAEHVADFIFNPPGAATEEAQDLARRTTLQQELDGKTKQIHQALSGPISRWIVPFFKTPMNALLYVRDRSPIAPFTKPYKEAMAQGGAVAAKAKMQWQLGTATFATIAMMHDQDMITGNISADPRVRASYERRGIKPYSIRIPGTDTWVPYNTAEPISTIIGLAADVAEAIKSGTDTDDRTNLEAMFGAIAIVGHNLTNKSFMVGVSKFMDAMQDPQRKLNAFMMNYATSALMPGSSLLNELARLQDDVKRYRRKTGIGLLDKIGTGMQTKLPFAQSSVLPARDAWGRIRSRSRFGLHDLNPVDNEIARLRLAYAPYPENESKDVVYTDAQLDYFHKETGEAAFKALKKLLKNSDFKRLQKASKAGNVDATEDLRLEIRKIRQGAIKYGRMMVRAHPEFGPELKEIDKANREHYELRQQQYEKDTAQ